MKQKLSGREYTYVASMLFGMFFGAASESFTPLLSAAAIPF